MYRGKHAAVTASLFVAVLLFGDVTVYGQNAESKPGRKSAVFLATNDANHNEVITFVRNPDGTLEEGKRFATGGRGSGGNNDPLESQGSLTLTSDRSELLAVNAGSGQISVFSVHGSL